MSTSKESEEELDEIDNKITDLIDSLPSQKRGKVWTLIYKSREEAVLEERRRIVNKVRHIPGNLNLIDLVVSIINKDK